MKKITSLLALFLVCFGITAQITLPTTAERLTAEKLNACTGPKRILLKNVSNGNHDWYNMAGTFVTVPTCESLFEWTPAKTTGTFTLKKVVPTPTQGEGYMLKTGPDKFGASADAAEFKAVQGVLYGKGDSKVTNHPKDFFDQDEKGYIRLMLPATTPNKGGLHKHININKTEYDYGTGSATVQNVYDATDYYTVTYNLDLEGTKQTMTGVFKTGDKITAPEIADYEPQNYTPVDKTAADNQVVEISYKKVAMIEVTYKYMFNGKELKPDEKKQQAVGSAFEVPAMDYVTVAYSTTEPVSATNNTVTVTYTENLPFEVTTDLKSAKWYNIQMHDKYYWKNDGTNVTVNIPASGEDLNVDAYSWCFMGNVFDGFKIYNKADNTKALYAPIPEVKDEQGNVTTLIQKAVLGEAVSAAEWKLHVSDYTKDMTCFSLNGVDYLNNAQQTKDVAGQPTNDNNFYLFYSNKKGNGSSCNFIPLTGEAGVVAALVAEWRKVVRYAGGIADKSVLDKAEKAATVAEAEKIINDAPKNEILADEYYRLLNVADAKSLTLANSTMSTAVRNEGDVDQLWQLAKNAEGKYTLKHANTNKFGNPTDNGMSETEVLLTATDCGKAVWTLSDGANNLKVNTDQWYLIPVEQIQVTLNTDGAMSWATIYLPFDAKCAVDGMFGLEYYGIASTTSTSAQLQRVEGVTANQGVIIRSTKNKKDFFFIKIGKNAKNVVAPTFENLLKGTNVAMPKTASSLVLGKNEQGVVGLYAPKAADLKANRAYLETAAAANGLKFVFGEATGVESVEVAVPANAVYYDLSGRRVANPTKGIYVVNGKKVYVK